MNPPRTAIPPLLALALVASTSAAQQKPQREHADRLPPLQRIIEPGEEGLDDSPAPRLGMSVNGTLELTVRQGTPLVLEASLHHRFHAPLRWQGEPLRIQDKQGAWLPLIHLGVRNSHQEAVTWPWKLEATPTRSLELNHERAGTLRALLSPDASAHLAPGEYTLTLTLDSRRNGASGSFRGRVEASPASIKILPASTVLTPEEEEEEARHRATYFLARGQKDKALEVANTLVSKFPERPGALGVKADVLEEMGDLKGAYHLFSRALDLAVQQHPSQQEPSSYGLRLAQLRRKMAAAK